jgi:hypothetical protein
MRLQFHVFLLLAEVSTAVENFGVTHSAVSAARSKLFQYHSAALQAHSATLSADSLVRLRNYSSRSAVVIEFGSRQLSLAWAILLGLNEAPPSIGEKMYISVGPRYPPREALARVASLAERSRILFTYLAIPDIKLSEYSFFINSTDLLVIDSLHTFCHAYHLLEIYSEMTQKFIAVLTTNDRWSSDDEDSYTGDYSEYPRSYQCISKKRGVAGAVSAFLGQYNYWVLEEKQTYGIIVIRRKIV